MFELRSTLDALHVREVELARLALYDGLTGLANRSSFARHLETAMTDPQRQPAIAYIDLDGFKQLNDRFGHGVGDELLSEAARRLEACAEAEMLVARLGGDEFVVSVPSGEVAAAELAQRVLDAFSSPFSVEDTSVAFQVSIGLAGVPPGSSADEAIRRADAAMYVAKSTGRGRAVLYPDETLSTAPVRDQASLATGASGVLSGSAAEIRSRQEVPPS